VDRWRLWQKAGVFEVRGAKISPMKATCSETKLTTRRDFLGTASRGLVGAGLGLSATEVWAQLTGDRPAARPEGVTVLNPLARVPVSLIIDDSTCLVNLNKFAVPQFATAWAGQQKLNQPWRDWPNEIPDRFVRKFGEWCAEHGVKGKYSIVPYPACVGRLDRLLPGWTAQELDDSLELVRKLMMPNWDIHPEMVTHTWVIDLKTGQPYPERTLRYMENWDWSKGRSVQELADYMRYALNILKNVGLPCEGITTPGGFGNQALPELAQATLQSCRDVYKAEIPHYFRHIYASGDRSVAPRVEYAGGLDGPDPKCVVSIIGGTGDWTGGWDCSARGDADRFITRDLKSGRMVELIERGEPALMTCHWTGIYFNGEEEGFKTFQEVVRRLKARFDNLLWMTLSEISRYWAAKELTRIEKTGNTLVFRAPFGTPRFTVQVTARAEAVPQLSSDGKPLGLKEVASQRDFKPGTWWRGSNGLVVCFDLPKGRSELNLK
jgi:hypothetical protein